jgi:MFS family permease
MVSAAEVLRQPVSGREILRNRNFIVYLAAAIVSNAGSFMQSLSVPFVLLDLTDSYTWVGVGTFAWMVPSLVVGPLAGTVSDRFDRRHVLLWSNLVQLCAALGLWALAFTDAMSPVRIISLVVVGGLGAGFQYTASQSMAAVLLPPEQLLQGVRLNSTGFTAARALGPAVAGVVLATWGATAAFGINAASFLCFIVALLFVRTRPVTLSTSTEGWVERFRSGFRYVRARPALRLVVMSAFVGAFFGQSMVQLAVGLAEDEYHVGGGGLGALVGVYGVGSTAASVLLVIGDARLRRSRMAMLGLSLFGVGLLVSVTTQWFVLAIVGFLVAGVAHGLTNISLNTAVQAQVHEEYRGRALSLFLMALLAGMPFGALAGGLLGDLVGLRPTLATFAAVVLAYLLFVIVRRDRMAALDIDGPAD